MAEPVIPLFWRVWLAPRMSFAEMASRRITFGEWVMVAAISAMMVIADWELSLAFGAEPSPYGQMDVQKAVLSPGLRVAAAIVSTQAVFLLNRKYARRSVNGRKALWRHE